MDTLIVLVVAVLLIVAAVVPYHRARRRRERRTAQAAEYARSYGLHEPVSLHPVVDPARCIGSGGCIAACPEQDVLGLVNGQAVAVSPARCVGHGLCERSCPVEAIQLVFGTERRGVELPRIRENYETNVPGLYIVGELGGMGLIRNAFEQGRQCIEGIRREDRTVPPDALDVLVVGCGPAGLSAALSCLHHGLRFMVVEKEEEIGGAVRSYPRKKLVMTSPFRVPGYGRVNLHEVSKEGLVGLWLDMIERTGLQMNTGETVHEIVPCEGDCFLVMTGRAAYKTRRVVLAIGRRGVPRKLGVPGEGRGNVYYALAEPEHFGGSRVTVVGGGDSAVEAALMLADQPGTAVRLSYRRDALARVKPANLERFEAAVQAGRIQPLWGTEVCEIDIGRIALRDPAGSVQTVETDDLFVFIGGELPTAFLKSCGIEMDVKFGSK